LKRLSREHKQLALIITLYVLFFFGLAYRRFMVFGWDTGDFGNFHDMFWWTFRGKPFFFASQGLSNFGLHAAFLWVQLLPVLWLFPSVPTLIFMQSVFLGLAGIPVYLIAHKLFDDHITALLLTLAFLMFPPIASQHVNQIEEPSFFAVYVLTTFYFYMTNRFRWFMVFALISCLGRENVPLAIATFGVLALIQRRSWKWVWAPPAVGIPYFLVVYFVIMPWFRHGGQSNAVTRMFTYLGTSAGGIVITALTKPGLVIDHLLSGEIIQYLIFLVQPLAWVLPLLSPVCLLALPDLAINTIADNNALRVIGWHYNVVTGTFLFVSALLGMKKVADWLRKRSGDKGQATVMAAALVLLSVAHWFLWLQPQQYKKLPYHDSLVRALAIVPDGKSVLVPPDLQGHVCGREHWHITEALVRKPEFAAQFEYIILDANERRFGPVVTQEFFDSLYKNPRYQLIFAEQNVFVFHRLGGESDWKVPPPS
jgi:uncharacterized membrane protein